MGQFIAPVKKTDERETPDEFYRGLDNEFHFTRDVCASNENYKHPEYWTAADDALSRPWEGTCWMNPPYSQLGRWVKKALEESTRGVTTVCLVPSATDTRWWHEYATRAEIRFVRGRLKFKNMPYNAPFPSTVLIFRSKKHGDSA